LLDNKPFSTEFSHTRFLVPALMGYAGRALFLDADMIFLSDVNKLFQMFDGQVAVQCVKHLHHPPANVQKMDGRLQLQYYRKNWSSFVLWNCGHPANRKITKEKVNYMPGRDLHAFTWLLEDEIGSISYQYNYISGVSPNPTIDGRKMQPSVIHYTEGGPWFPECKNVPYADLWDDERRIWEEAGAQSYHNYIHTVDK